jgi:hypothetical protein
VTEAYRKKIDDADGMQFLTAFTEVLHRNGIISSSNAQGVRAFLLSASTSPTESVWETAISGCPLMPLLQARYATRALSLNIFHFTLRPLLQEAIGSWGRFGAALLGKIESHLNRPFFVYEQQAVESQALYAHLLIELAGVVEQGCHRLQQVLVQMSRWVPHGMAGVFEGDLVVEAQLATALGFSEVEDRILYEVAAASARQEMLVVYRLLTEWIEASLQRAGFFPGEVPSTSRICWAECRGIRSAIQQIEGVSFPREAGLLEQEWVRKTDLEAFQRIQGHMEALQQALLVLLSRETEVGSVAVPFSRALERRLTDTLLREGVGFDVAKEAVLALFGYCRTHRIAPQEILVGELCQIHPALSVESLKILQDNTVPASLRVSHPEEKQRLLSLATSLLQRFSTYLPLGVLLVGFWGCGVKTLPKSDALELRPEIPFLSEKISANKEENTDEVPKKSLNSGGRLDRADHPL